MSKEQYFPTFGALWQKAESQACTLRARVRETLEEEVEQLTSYLASNNTSRFYLTLSFGFL